MIGFLGIYLWNLERDDEFWKYIHLVKRHYMRFNTWQRNDPIYGPAFSTDNFNGTPYGCHSSKRSAHLNMTYIKPRAVLICYGDFPFPEFRQPKHNWFLVRNMISWDLVTWTDPHCIGAHRYMKQVKIVQPKRILTKACQPPEYSQPTSTLLQSSFRDASSKVGKLCCLTLCVT